MFVVRIVPTDLFLVDAQKTTWIYPSICKVIKDWLEALQRIAAKRGPWILASSEPVTTFWGVQQEGFILHYKKNIRNIQAVWVDVRFSLCFFDPSTRQFSKKQVPRIVSSFPVFQLILQNWLSYARLTNAALPWRVAPWILETFFGVANWPTVMKLNLDTTIWEERPF